MLVAFSIGPKSRDIIQSMKKSIDNVDFYTYKNVQALIKEAKLRKLSFKRIILSTTFLSKDASKDLSELNDYIKEYSPSSEVVLFTVKGKREDVFEDFIKVFNSPMYAPLVLDTTTLRLLSGIVLNDIGELIENYAVSGYGKNGILSESENILENVSETPSTVDTIQSGDFDEYCGSYGTDTSSTLGTYAVNDSSYENQMESNLHGSEIAPTGAEVISEGSGNLEVFEDDDLSLGGFGETHSDTGYLDEDGDAELQEFIRQQEDSSSTGTKSVETKKLSTSGKGKKVEVKKKQVSPANIDLIIACRGTGATQAIVDEAAKIEKVDKAKVLIIDLDNRDNGLLSYIDLDKYYQDSAYQGISKQRVYMEDGIGIASNGYGYRVKSKELKNFLDSKLLSRFDMVYIDCPADCLDVITEEILDMCNIFVMSGCDLSQLISTSVALTNRSIVPLGVERGIMSRCFIDFNGGKCSDDDIGYLKDTCLFANGNWLSRIGK